MAAWDLCKEMLDIVGVFVGYRPYENGELYISYDTPIIPDV